MGIVLPPVQHTSFRRTHHRNRSLDSVLQEIPELEAAEEPALKPALSCPLKTPPLRPALQPATPPPPPPQRPAPSVAGRLTAAGGEDASSLGSTDSGISSDGSEREFETRSAAPAMASRGARPAEAVQPAGCDSADSGAGEAVVAPDAGLEPQCGGLAGDEPAVTPAVTSVMVANPGDGDAPEDSAKSTGAPQKSWLLRLFESKMFDMSIAVNYLFNSKEPGVQMYIGK